MIQFWKYGEAVNDENEVETNFFNVPAHSSNQMTFTRFNQTRTLSKCGHLDRTNCIEMGTPTRLLSLPATLHDKVTVKHVE